MTSKKRTRKSPKDSDSRARKPKIKPRPVSPIGGGQGGILGGPTSGGLL